MPAPSASDSSAPVVALIGNPNTGKSTLFNALCGGGARTGNYPGCTVEEKIGRATFDGRAITFVDLPGTYSLAPRSRDEMAAVDVLLGRLGKVKPNVVVCIVDATNLERNLYLVSQVLELGLPTVVALNMVDAAKERGVAIDRERLETQLGVPVIPTVAHRSQGVAELKAALASAAARGSAAPPASPFPPAFQDEVETLHRTLNPAGSPEKTPRFLVERLLLDVSDYLEGVVPAPAGFDLHGAVAEARTRLKAAGAPVPAVEAISRYKWVGQVLSGVVTRPAQRVQTFGDRVDRWLTHQWFGTFLFAALMFVVFQAIYAWSEPLMGAIETAQGWVQEAVGSRLPDGTLKSLIVDGIIAGVGGVVVFLPQILVLFLFIGVLEDCGYMARVAFLMDKIMSRVGLSGKSFIPLLSSFACAVPGIMAARVIENSRDRLATILIAPLMSCSARLPVYTILIAAFIPPIYLFNAIDLRGLVMFSMYLVGIVVAIAVAWALKKTILRGETPPFVLELPSYKWPSIGNVIRRMIDRGWAFVYRAGTLILAVSVVVWFLSYYPRLDESTLDAVTRAEAASLTSLEEQRDALRQKLDELEPRTPDVASKPPVDEPESPDAAKWRGELEPLEAELARVQHKLDRLQQEQSYLGQMGKAIEPAVEPLGWDWRIGSAAIASFPAREVVVSVLGVIYSVGADVDVEDEEQRTRMAAALQDSTWPEGTARAGQKIYTIPVALSIMVFFALCAQCAATLAAIKRETNSWFWPVFTFVYMTALAYLAAFAVYQIGTALGW